MKFEIPKVKASQAEQQPKEAHAIKITRKDVIEHRAMAKNPWHDQKWHDFFNSEKHIAIMYALDCRDAGDGYKEIIARANDYNDYIETMRD